MLADLPITSDFVNACAYLVEAPSATFPVCAGRNVGRLANIELLCEVRSLIVDGSESDLNQ